MPRLLQSGLHHLLTIGEEIMHSWAWLRSSEVQQATDIHVCLRDFGGFLCLFYSREFVKKNNKKNSGDCVIICHLGKVVFQMMISSFSGGGEAGSLWCELRFEINKALVQGIRVTQN